MSFNCFETSTFFNYSSTRGNLDRTSVKLMRWLTESKPFKSVSVSSEQLGFMYLPVTIYLALSKGSLYVSITNKHTPHAQTSANTPSYGYLAKIYGDRYSSEPTKSTIKPRFKELRPKSISLSCPCLRTMLSTLMSLCKIFNE